MSFTLNKVQLIGRIGSKPELSHTKTNIPVTNFYIATDELTNEVGEDGRKKKRTEWHRIVAWKNVAEYVTNYLDKGNLIFVEGKLKTREYKDPQGNEKKTIEIVADNINLVYRQQKREDSSENVSTPEAVE
jgi:single-strand DNA-binding protein